MVGFFKVGIFLVTISATFAAVDNNKTVITETFKESPSNGLKSFVTPLNAESCAEAIVDGLRHCSNFGDNPSCGTAQSYINCYYDQVSKNCGSKEIKKFCDEQFNQLAGQLSDCKGLYCSANSLVVSSSIVAVVLFKMFLEKIIL